MAGIEAVSSKNFFVSAEPPTGSFVFFQVWGSQKDYLKNSFKAMYFSHEDSLYVIAKAIHTMNLKNSEHLSEVFSSKRVDYLEKRFAAHNERWLVRLFRWLHKTFGWECKFPYTRTIPQEYLKIQRYTPPSAQSPTTQVKKPWEGKASIVPKPPSTPISAPPSSSPSAPSTPTPSKGDKPISTPLEDSKKEPLSSTTPSSQPSESSNLEGDSKKNTFQKAKDFASGFFKKADKSSDKI